MVEQVDTQLNIFRQWSEKTLEVFGEEGRMVIEELFAIISGFAAAFDVGFFSKSKSKSKSRSDVLHCIHLPSRRRPPGTILEKQKCKRRRSKWLKRKQRYDSLLSLFHMMSSISSSVESSLIPTNSGRNNESWRRPKRQQREEHHQLVQQPDQRRRVC